MSLLTNPLYKLIVEILIWNLSCLEQLKKGRLEKEQVNRLLELGISQNETMIHILTKNEGSDRIQ